MSRDLKKTTQISKIAGSIFIFSVFVVLLCTPPSIYVLLTTNHINVVVYPLTGLVISSFFYLSTA